MKLGLIARATQTGLGIQTREMARNLPWDRVLVVTGVGGPTNVGMVEHLDWYPGAMTLPSLEQHRLDERSVRNWMDGLDAVVSVETPYDWNLPRWADEMGVRTVIHGNPEFYKHDQDASRARPSAWWWPTPWRLRNLPQGPVVQVPAPDDAPLCALLAHSGPLTVVHVVGRAAHADRNGTEPFLQALSHVREKVHVRLCYQGKRPTYRPRQRNVSIEEMVDVEDRFAMYHGAHVLVMPRKYGGLHLPAIEALACGLAVVMPDCSPNWIWPIIPMAYQTGTLRLPCGQVEIAVTDPAEVARVIDSLARDRDRLASAQAEARRWTVDNRWSRQAKTYHEELAEVLR